MIFSFEEDRGADIDLATNGAENIYGKTLLGAEFGGAAVFQFTRHLLDGTIKRRDGQWPESAIDAFECPRMMAFPTTV